MAIATAGSASGTTSGTSLTISYSSTAGSLLVLGIAHPVAVASVTDNAGNVWSHAVESAATGSSPSILGLWICPNAAAITSVTITFASAAACLAGLVEVTGIPTTRPRWKGVIGNLQSSSSMGFVSATGNVAVGDYLIEFGGYASTSSGTRQETISGAPAGIATITGAQAISGTSMLACQGGVNTASSGSVSLGWTLPTSRSNGVVYLVTGPPATGPFKLGTTGLIKGTMLSTWTHRMVAIANPVRALIIVPIRRLFGQIWPR